MQIINEGNWVERSLSYLCRTFDSLEKGQNYSEALPAVQSWTTPCSPTLRNSTPPTA